MPSTPQPSTQRQPPKRQDLPIDALLPALADAVRDRPAVVLRASTGAGKTTRVPPALLPLVAGQIVLLEPRRVAARAAARRIAFELGVELGREVGYQVRFDRVAGAATRILVVTEGILVQMLQRDPFLEGIGAVILDEFHERHLTSDLSLAMTRKVQREARPDLKLVVMSATLDPAPLVAFLDGDAAVLDSPGRQYPVAIHYLERADARGLPTQVKAAILEALASGPGDLLVFLPGVGEIHRCQEALEGVAREQGLRLLPLYGELPAEQQDAVLLPGNKRKIVLATNVAESSLTIDGVRLVIDSGQARFLRYDPAYGLDRLELGRISRASAEQRAGRAGRQAPGHCWRLWTEVEQRTLPERDVPEIQRLDLASTALELLAWGESDVRAFAFFERPDRAALDRALALLDDLGAREGGHLTPLGRRLAQLPLHPRLARLLLAGHTLGELDGAALIAAMLSERDVVFRPVGQRPVVAAATIPSDLFDRLEAVRQFGRSGYAETALGPVDGGRARNALRVGRQLADIAVRRLGPEPAPDGAADEAEALSRALLAAWPDRVARRRERHGRRAVMVGGRGVRLAEMSGVHEAELFLAIEIDGGAAGERSEALVRQASAIEAAWLDPAQIEHVVEVYFDAGRERVAGRKVVRYRDLALSETELAPSAAEASRVLAEAAAERLEQALALDDPAVVAFLARIRSLAGWMPELELPLFEPDEIRALLPALAAGRRSFADLRKAPLLEQLESLLDYREREALARYAPARLEVPSGSQMPLLYEPGRNPVLAVRIQEVFGLAETPRVAGGRVPVVLHLLAPNYRPQQVTQDLASFWRTTYPLVRKELAGRYPKHAWPTDPLTAPPQRKGKSTR
jgi:ATP-dependent helicase HrpB